MCFDSRSQLLLLGIHNKEIIKHTESIHSIMKIFQQLNCPKLQHCFCHFHHIEVYQSEEIILVTEGKIATEV